MHKVAALLVLFTLSAGLAAADSDQRSGYLLSFEFNGDEVALAGATWLPRFEPAAALPHSHAWRVELIEEAGKESLWFANLPPPAGLAAGMPPGASFQLGVRVPVPPGEARLRLLDESGRVRFSRHLDADFDEAARRERAAFLDWMNSSPNSAGAEGAAGTSDDTGDSVDAQEYIRAQRQMNQRRQSGRRPPDCRQRRMVAVPGLADAVEPCLPVLPFRPGSAPQAADTKDGAAQTEDGPLAAPVSPADEDPPGGGVHVIGTVTDAHSGEGLRYRDVVFTGTAPEGGAAVHVTRSDPDGIFPEEDAPDLILHGNTFYHAVEAGVRDTVWEPPLVLQTGAEDVLSLDIEIGVQHDVELELLGPWGFPMPRGRAAIWQDGRFVTSVVADDNGKAELTLARGSYQVLLAPDGLGFTTPSRREGYLLFEGVSETGLKVDGSTSKTLRINSDDIARIRLEEFTANFPGTPDRLETALYELLREGEVVAVSRFLALPQVVASRGGHSLTGNIYVPAGREYQLRIRLPGRPAVTTNPFVAKDGMTLRFELPGQDQEQRWSGVVRDDRGQPLSGVVIDSFDAAMEPLTMVYSETEGDGKFSVPACSGCIYRFKVPEASDNLVAHLETLENVSASIERDVVLERIEFVDEPQKIDTLQRVYGDPETARYELLFIGSGYTEHDESFTDLNGNGVWDGVLFYDLNGNGVLDGNEPFAVYGDADPPIFGRDPTVDNEPFVDRNGDGFPNIGEAQIFQANVRDYMRAALGYDYWRDHRDLFMAWSWLSWSKQAGMNVDADAEGRGRIESRDTLLDATWETERSLLSVDYTRATQLANEVLPSFDVVVVMINQPIRAGRANSFILATGGLQGGSPNSATPAHELGHNPGGLLDEYSEFSGIHIGSTPPALHMTRSINKAQLPWHHHLDHDREFRTPSPPGTAGTGVFEGGWYQGSGIYRSSYNSTMRNASVRFSPNQRELMDWRLDVEAGTKAVLKAQPEQRCTDAERAAVVLSWDVQNHDGGALEIRLGAADGKLFSRTSRAQGKKTTGRWVRDGDSFFLVDGNSGDVLATTAVQLNADCQVSLQALLISEHCSATGRLRAEIEWNAAGTPARRLQIRLDDERGKLYSKTSRLQGSSTTGPWVSNGDRFVLLDDDSLEILASATAQPGPECRGER